MGNKQDLSDTKRGGLLKFLNINKNSTQSLYNNSFLEINTKDESSYKGLRSTDDSTKNSIEDQKNKIFLSNNSSLENLSREFKETKTPIIFEWNGPGDTVYLTGSFGNWHQLFFMKKINEKFQIVLVNFLLFLEFTQKKT